jgi:3-(3-hydroxy-phenyl)propionate hydroxylase
MNQDNEVATSVAILGAGPTGLALGRLLSLKGVPVTVIDSRRIVCQHPRATHLDDETMRTLQTLGVAEREPDFLHVAGASTYYDADGEEFMALEMPGRESDQGWFTDYMFHQPDFESQLRGRLWADKDATLLFGWAATEIRQDDAGVTILARKANGDAAVTVHAQYLIGCDGARSFVREWMSAPYEDLKGTQRSLIIDVHPFRPPVGLPTTEPKVFCRPGLPVTYVPIFPPKLRFEFMILDDRAASEVEDPGNVYEMLSPWLDPGSYRIQRADVYEWNARLVSRWRSGRVLLAGDAAHEMPPLLGQGMCSGLRDAMNLAWKLALVVNGVAADALLDTYQSERLAHVRPFIEESARHSNLMESLGRGAQPPVRGVKQVVEQFRPPLGPGLQEPAPGTDIARLAPQPRGAAGEKLDDVTGYNFVVMGSPATISGTNARTRQAWRSLGAHVVTDPGPAVSNWLAACGASAALIRPDRYTYALPAGPAELDQQTAELAKALIAHPGRDA